MTSTRAVTAVGALTDPIRRSLYEYIAGRHEPVSREEAATAVQISLSKAKFHLDRLEKDGLLEVELRRLTGRTGPGAGRPAKLYRRADREVQVSLPERRYDVVGAVLAAAVEQVNSGSDLDTAIHDSAYARGIADAGASTAPVDEAEPAIKAAIDDAERTLSRLGYEPEVREAGIVLHNCPFDTLAAGHRDLVCSMNQRYVQGVLDATCAGALDSELSPAPGYCCVVARLRRGEPKPAQATER